MEEILIQKTIKNLAEIEFYKLMKISEDIDKKAIGNTQHS